MARVLLIKTIERQSFDLGDIRQKYKYSILFNSQQRRIAFLWIMYYGRYIILGDFICLEFASLYSKI